MNMILIDRFHEKAMLPFPSHGLSGRLDTMCPGIP